MKKLSLKNLNNLMKIKSIKEIDYKGDVYNLRIKDNHNYFSENICVSNCHGAKAKTITTILHKTFGHAYSRFGVSGTFPPDDSCEILTIQSVLGPKITEVSAAELKEKGIITPMDVKVVLMNHQDTDYGERLEVIKRGGMGKEALELEKDFIHNSEKRLNFIKKIVEKCDTNTLLLFHSIEYGQKILSKLNSEITDKEFYYIDGEVRNKQREEIKKFMEETKRKVEYTILNFGNYEIDVKSDFKILLNNGLYKNAADISTDDDIDEKFIKNFLIYKK
jgi:superfamily II DNA or RNA helicase